MLLMTPPDGDIRKRLAIGARFRITQAAIASHDAYRHHYRHRSLAVQLTAMRHALESDEEAGAHGADDFARREIVSR